LPRAGEINDEKRIPPLLIILKRLSFVKLLRKFSFPAIGSPVGVQDFRLLSIEGSPGVRRRSKSSKVGRESSQGSTVHSSGRAFASF
jgi:hypothetical protein